MTSTWPLRTLGSVATMYLLSQNVNSILLLVCRFLNKYPEIDGTFLINIHYI